MKRTMTFIAVAAVTMFSAQAHAYTKNVGGVEWTYTVNYDDTASIFNTSYAAAIPVNTTGLIVIPSSFDDYPVTSIGALAFMGCSGVTGVTIPDSVTSIGSYAFAGCSGIKSVTIPQCVCSSHIQEVFPSAYSTITDVVISDGVTCIEDYAFLECASLVRVTIPDSVARIGEGAFEECNDALFDKTTIPGVKLVDGWAVGNAGGIAGSLALTGIRGIGDSAFAGCGELEHVTISDSVKSIGYGAFESCEGLRDVYIGAGVTNIGEFAFWGCSSLASVTIGSGVTGIGAYAFSYCGNITNITFMGEPPSIPNDAFKDVASNCVAYVLPSKWPDVVEGQKWNGLTIKFLDEADDELVAEIVDMATEADASGGVLVTRMIVDVVAKNGETIVAVDASKVAAMFEATSDLGNWNGAAKLTPTVEVLEGDGATMRFRVTPGDGTASSAFLRIRK